MRTLRPREQRLPVHTAGGRRGQGTEFKSPLSRDGMRSWGCPRAPPLTFCPRGFFLQNPPPRSAGSSDHRPPLPSPAPLLGIYSANVNICYYWPEPGSRVRAGAGSSKNPLGGPGLCQSWAPLGEHEVPTHFPCTHLTPDLCWELETGLVMEGWGLTEPGRSAKEVTGREDSHCCPHSGPRGEKEGGRGWGAWLRRLGGRRGSLLTGGVCARGSWRGGLRAPQMGVEWTGRSGVDGRSGKIPTAFNMQDSESAE